MSLGALLGPNYFAHTGGHVLSFGAGGSATALILHFSRTTEAGDRPPRMVIVNRSPGRIEELRRMAETLGWILCSTTTANRTRGSTTH